jgi:ribosomal protein S12 methylthiotransferase accessory factor YcaO
MAPSQGPIDYRLELKETSASTGYFAAVPGKPPALDAGLAYLCRHPFDSFMHAHVLAGLEAMDSEAVAGLLSSDLGKDPTVRALLLEASTLYEHQSAIRARFNSHQMLALAQHTPAIFLQSEALPDQALHRQWARLFRANLVRHRPLPPPAATGLPSPVEAADGNDSPLPEAAHLKSVVARVLPQIHGLGHRRPSLEETIALATERLGRQGLFEGGEMRHQASLSPCALMRRWRFNRRVHSSRLHYTLSSVQTAYGRGLSWEAARASCLMEVVERWAAFAGVDADGITGTRRPHPVVHGSRSTLAGKGCPTLDPNDLGLEVPYGDDPLYWMEGQRLTERGVQPVWVPVQCVFLFCNLDERALFSGLGSSGLASGNTIEEARLSALYELLERDSQAVNPYHPARCFRIYATDARLNALLEDYRARGIHLQFQDISPVYGIPCCTCFVTHHDGSVATGGGAHLNGKQAVLSALTETPYPYPVGPPSAPAPPDLPWLAFESLPDFSTGMPDLDLKLLEQTLLANGFAPIYVDITRKDTGLPVVKALVPGFECMADFDAYSRISFRLFNNYLKIHYKQ